VIVEGKGLIDCHLYRQPARMILHIVNLSGHGAWRQPVDELIAIGPLRVKVKLADDVRGDRLRSLVSDRSDAGKVVHGWVEFEIASVMDHEVIIIS
jgi:hypothetical protein